MTEPQHSLIFTTALGSFEMVLETEKAPQTAGYFRHLAHEGLLDNTSFFRIVNEANNSHNPECPIQVIQGGLGEEAQVSLPVIEHEPTVMTGLKHTKWTVSAARRGVGETYGSFFITMGDEPSLNYGGARHPDGQGFAAFGHIVSGFTVLETIFARAEPGEYLRRLIPIIKVEVV